MGFGWSTLISRNAGPVSGSRSLMSITVVTPPASFVTNSRSSNLTVPLSISSLIAGAIRPVNVAG